MSDEGNRELSAVILAGEADRARDLTSQLLDAGRLPEEILASELIPAMDVAGDRFEAREFFLPDLLLSARAMQEALALLTPLLAARDVPPVGSVVIGTAAGDLHDIGKNIVAAVLQGGGFTVHDLGYDVSPETFVLAVKEHDPDIVAVSALLTTTMPVMEDVVVELERQGVRGDVKVLVGGAPLSETFAAKVGADAYAPTAAAAVRRARELVGGKVAERKPVTALGETDERARPARAESETERVAASRRLEDSVASRELVWRTLEFEGPERLPRQLWLLPWAETRYPDAVAEIERDFPSDIVPIPLFCSEPVPGQGNAHSVGRFVDAWGCTFENLQDGIIGEVKDPLVEDWTDTDHIRFPRERLRIDRERVTQFCGSTDRYVLAGTCPRPFERLQFLRGTENLYLDLGRPSSALRDFLMRLHEFYLEELTIWARTEVDGITFMDDWGSQHALLISPELWRDMFKPLYAEYVSIAHAHGKHAFMHSDGHITDIIPDLIEIGLDALNAQVACMGVVELGKRFGGELTFWGELDRQQLLPYGAPTDVRRAARDLIGAFHRDGGFIAQCEFGPGARPENVTAFFDECARE